MKQYNFFDELIVDNFAGGGGASTGIELATGRPVDIAINHDPDAILMHMTNHPFTRHYCESVWDVNLKELCGGHPVGLMWLSPDCKHFSRAKGGKPVSKNIRGLAWIAVRWAAMVKPRVIILENVPEFVTWGPLDENNYPDPKKKGKTFNSFVNALRSYGYKVKWEKLKACDYGAPTIRKRFFLIARCDSKPIVFPEPTHGEGKIPYRTAAECIDWNIPCKSIFERTKPLAENTLRRIARGLVKFTINADKPFLVPIVNQSLLAPSLIQYHSETSATEVRGQALNKPIMTVDGSPRYGLMSAYIVKYYSGNNYSAVNDPLATITTRERHGLIEIHLCVLRNNQDCKSLNEPLPTECTSGGHFAEIRTSIIKYHPENGLGHWKEIRELLNKYCGYNFSDDEILLIDIEGENYYIADIGMRMLEPRELYNAQGFPPDYIIDHDYKGNVYPRSKQIARCGNAVPPPFAEALVRANLPEMCGDKIMTMHEFNKVI
ncbi:MAG: DNA cytosine methyltransferase [Oscillospiraceae bacterium]